MQEIYKNVIELLNNKEYGKILKIIIGIFIFTAPSLSCIFIYERELFMTLDIIKLSILCTILNLILIIIIFIIVLICKIYKFETTVTFIISKQGEELKYYQNKEKEINSISEETDKTQEREAYIKGLIELSDSLIQNDIKNMKTEFYEEIFLDTIIFITTYTIIIWAYQFIFTYFNVPFISDYGIVTMLVYMFGYIFKSIIDLFNVNKTNGRISSIKKSSPLILMLIMIILFFIIDSIMK